MSDETPKLSQEAIEAMERAWDATREERGPRLQQPIVIMSEDMTDETRRQIEAEVKRWRQDPSVIMVAPIPTKISTIQPIVQIDRHGISTHRIKADGVEMSIEEFNLRHNWDRLDIVSKREALNVVLNERGYASCFENHIYQGRDWLKLVGPDHEREEILAFLEPHGRVELLPEIPVAGIPCDPDPGAVPHDPTEGMD